MDGMLSQEEINALLAGANVDGLADANTDGEETLTDEQKDAIGEISNISMGTAATTLSTLLNQTVNITTPKVTYMNWQELADSYDKPCVFLQISYTSGTMTIVCCFLSGLIIASAFSSIVVYATDLMPDKVGMIAGVFFGLMFGLGGLGSAFFGWLADKTSVEFIFQVSAFLPLMGIVAGLLPNTQKAEK